MSKYVWLLVPFLAPLILYLIYEYLAAIFRTKKEKEINALNEELQQRIDKSARQISEIEEKLKETK